MQHKKPGSVCWDRTNLLRLTAGHTHHEYQDGIKLVLGIGNDPISAPYQDAANPFQLTEQ